MRKNNSTFITRVFDYTNRNGSCFPNWTICMNGLPNRLLLDCKRTSAKLLKCSIYSDLLNKIFNTAIPIRLIWLEISREQIQMRWQVLLAAKKKKHSNRTQYTKQSHTRKHMQNNYKSISKWRISPIDFIQAPIMLNAVLLNNKLEIDYIYLVWFCFYVRVALIHVNRFKCSRPQPLACMNCTLFDRKSLSPT